MGRVARGPARAKAARHQAVVVIATRLLKLYHFTDSKNLPGVRKRGLRPHVGAMSEWGKVVWFTTFDPRPGEARALSVEIDRSDPHLEFAERLERGAEWWVYTNRRLLPVSDFSRKFVALQLSTFATQSTHRDISRAAEFGRYRGIA